MIKFTSLSNDSGGSVLNILKLLQLHFRTTVERKELQWSSLDVMKACTAISQDSCVRYFLIFDKFVSS